MTAREARTKSLKNQLSKEEALKQIDDQTNHGATCIVFHTKQLSDSAAMELMTEGYKISKHTDPITGGELYKADW